MKNSFSTEYLNIFIPILITVLASFLFSVTDTFFISTLGEAQLAGIGLIFPIIILVLAILGSLSTSIGINVSRAYGANKKERLKI